MRARILAALAAAILAGGGIGQSQTRARPSLEEQVRAIRAGQAVEVRFADGSKLRGWVGEISDTGFVLSHESGRRLTSSQLAFRQLASVRQVKDVKPAHTVPNILIGIAIVGVLIGSVFGIYVAAHGLG
jgi:hypothetical protein